MKEEEKNSVQRWMAENGINDVVTNPLNKEPKEWLYVSDIVKMYIQQIKIDWKEDTKEQKLYETPLMSVDFEKDEWTFRMPTNISVGKNDRYVIVKKDDYRKIINILL